MRAFERVAIDAAPPYPFAQLDYLRLVRSEVHIVVALKNGEHVEVVGQPPRHGVRANLGGEVGRVNEEENIGLVAVFSEEGLVVLVHDGKTVEVAVCTIVVSPNRIVECLLGEFCHVVGVFHREEERGRQGYVVDKAALFLFGNDFQYPVAVWLAYHLTTRQTVGDFTNAGQQRIGTWNGSDTTMIVVVVVIHHRGIRFFTLGHMGQ